jgi:hypothetical protein
MRQPDPLGRAGSARADRGWPPRGVELLAGLDRLAVMGFAELIPQLAFLRGLERRVRSADRLRPSRPRPPGRLPGLQPARRAPRPAPRACRCCTTSRPRCGRGIRGAPGGSQRTWTASPVIFPFEAEPLRAAGRRRALRRQPAARSRRVGRDAFRAGREPRDRARSPLLALLPGSRRQEIERHLETFVRCGAARRARAPRRAGGHRARARHPGSPFSTGWGCRSRPTRARCCATPRRRS